MTITTCKICHSSRIVPKFEIKEYRFLRCRACGFVFVDNVTEGDLRDFYEKEYFDGNRARYESMKLEQSLPAEKKWLVDNYIETFIVGRNNPGILEIGPSVDGGFVKHFMKRQNVRIECVEISKYASESLNANGIKTFNGKLHEYRSEASFDVAIATEVIEHDLDPQSFARSIFNALKSGGLFFGTTGNIASLISRINGRSWYYLDPPAHLSYFTSASIKILFRKCGFRQVDVLNVGFHWIDHLSRHKATFLLPFFSALRIATGMIIIAKK